MALAETTVVETVSECWPQHCLSQRCCSKPTSSQRGQEPSGRDDEKHATIGEGDCLAGQDLMAVCHGVRMGAGVFQYEGPVQGPLTGPIRDFANRMSPREQE
jgi:hypothetical protein